jgi:uncharacterized protein (DUF885 family)
MHSMNKIIVLALVLVFILTPSCSSRLPPTAPTRTPTPSIVADLEGLPIDAFFDASFKRLLLRDPEGITTAGLVEQFGTGNDHLTDISDTYLRQTQALERAIYALLQQYDRASLTTDQQLTYDVYANYLADRIRGQAFMVCDYPVNVMIYSVPTALVQFFTDNHPVSTQTNAQDYITRLSQVGTKFDQLIDNLKIREGLGVILPRMLIPTVLNELNATAAVKPEETAYYLSFAAKVSALPGVTAAEKQVLLDAARQQVEQTVQPAYWRLVDYFTHLQSIATDDAGVWKLSSCPGYYAYLLSHYTTTELTPDQVHALGLAELERIHTEMRVIFSSLGFPAGISLADAYTRAAADGGTVPASQIVSRIDQVIQAADTRLAPAFNLRPRAGVKVMPGPTGGYYQAPAVDGSRPGYYYAATTQDVPYYSLPTVAYHETIPGHHYQISIALELEQPILRRAVDFTAYTEGWALYAERLVWELGFYEGDPYGDLGRLQYEALRASRLVVDTGIHALKWTPDQAIAFMLENTGVPYRNEVYRYVVLPGQATAYEIGFLKILELRQQAEDQLGARFNLADFHDVILGHGALPLDLLAQQVESYIKP